MGAPVLSRLRSHVRASRRIQLPATPPTSEYAECTSTSVVAADASPEPVPSALEPEGKREAPVTEDVNRVAARLAERLLKDGFYEEARDLLELSLRTSPERKNDNSESLRKRLEEAIHGMATSRAEIAWDDAIQGRQTVPRVRQMEMTDEFDCVLCLKLLYEPVTTSCGHTFCRDCIVRALDHTDTCPMCRQVVHLEAGSHPVNITLKNIIEHAFPKEAKERELEAQAEAEAYSLRPNQLPLFPLSSVVLPGQTFPMHVFEARYRLMLRRILQGSGKFGLVSVRRSPETQSYRPRDVGCVMEIVRVETIPDGRSFVEARALSRFKIDDCWEVDGYMVGRVEPFEDVCEEDDPSDNTLPELKRALRVRINQLLARSQRPSFLRESLRRSGPMPDENATTVELSFWLASVLISDADERQSLLEMVNPRDRLLAAMSRLEKFESADEKTVRKSGSKCTIM